MMLGVKLIVCGIATVRAFTYSFLHTFFRPFTYMKNSFLFVFYLVKTVYKTGNAHFILKFDIKTMTTTNYGQIGSS